ncbi:aminoglycoside phosphotransferase [Parafrankia soli]|uniref:Aminoglycoside phosphotransferase n=1 Tax=Parafrankia soli TaxID=2599596 RepID=A0A1S1PUT1_9ACTN|nr:phosphotransferase [Parafrankia soli]OHV25450.1 aminoglycoside phosphotransferase [Parafrankia soli]
MTEPAGGQPGWIVDDPNTVTPEWMTGALRRGGTDTEVVGLRHQPVGRGQIAPGYRSEVGYYTRFAPSARIRVPRCWSADISADGRSFTLVLEDGHPARPGLQVEGCDVRQAEAALRNLAGLHGPFWNKPDLADGADWLRRTDEAALGFLSEVFAGAVAPFLDRFRDRLAPTDTDTLLRTADLLARWGRHVGTRHTLIHGDYRLDNLLFTEPRAAGESHESAESHGLTASREVTALDWQSLEIGFAGRDVAYFLATALPPALRRAQEKNLVRTYHERLVRMGVDDYPLDECFRDYRLGTPQAPLLTVLGSVYATNEPTESSDRMFLSMITNACAAIRDLGTLDLLAP